MSTMDTAYCTVYTDVWWFAKLHSPAGTGMCIINRITKIRNFPFFGDKFLFFFFFVCNSKMKINFPVRRGAVKGLHFSQMKRKKENHSILSLPMANKGVHWVSSHRQLWCICEQMKEELPLTKMALHCYFKTRWFMNEISVWTHTHTQFFRCYFLFVLFRFI